MNTSSLQTAAHPARMALPMRLEAPDGLTLDSAQDVAGDTVANAVKVFGLMSAKLTSWNFAQDSWRVDEH